MQGDDKPIPELGNRTWAELELVEDEDSRLLFPDQIRMRTKEGWKNVKVRLRVPRPDDLLRARRETRVFFETRKLDEAKDKDLFEEAEQLTILALCMRTWDAPHPQFAQAAELTRGYDESSLRDVQGRLNHYRELVDPNPGHELSDVEVFEKILAIRRVGHLGPLVDIAGSEQRSFIMRMAELACLCPMVQCYVQSLVSSTAEPSPPASSSES